MNLNHNLVYSIVRGGIGILNPQVLPKGAGDQNAYGTVGLIATSNGADRWIVSAYHVLCRKGSDFPAGNSELIYSSTDIDRKWPLAVVDGQRADKALDFAAGLIIAAGSVGEILGISKLQPPIAPLEGMRVLKSGAKTGVTEGRITRQNAQRVEIAPVGMPPHYDLSEGGDSGAVWVDAATGSPVALHTGGNDWGDPERAFGVPIILVLERLGLQMVF